MAVFYIPERLLHICNSLIVYNLALSRRAVHTFNHYFTAVMHRLLDWSVVSLLVRGEVIYKITAHYFVVLRIRRQSTCLHAWDPAAHLRLIDPTDFRTLDRFRLHSWQVVAVHLWNTLPLDLLLTRAICGWGAILKQAQCQVS